jgi:hypothetical protein
MQGEGNCHQSTNTAYGGLPSEYFKVLKDRPSFKQPDLSYDTIMYHNYARDGTVIFFALISTDYMFYN